MKSRLIASVAVCAAVVLGATGCTMITPQTTQSYFPYSPVGGINVPSTAGATLQVRSALIVADKSGKTGNLLAAVVNATDQEHKLTVQVGDGSSRSTHSITVPAHSVSSLGANVDPLRIDDLNVQPGATAQVYFQSGDGDGALVHVPVLDGADRELRDFVPHATPKASASPTATPGATTAATPAPTTTP